MKYLIFIIYNYNHYMAPYNYEKFTDFNPNNKIFLPIINKIGMYA